MFWPLVTVVVVAVIMFVAMYLKTGRLEFIRSRRPWPYYARRLLTNPEQVLYHRLVKALPNHIVLAQVQLSRLLGVKKGVHFASWFNRINRKSVDFVVCQRDGSAVAAIELDDSTHSRRARQTADATKDKALESAGVRIIRWTVTSLPDESAIRAAFVDSGLSSRVGAHGHVGGQAREAS